MLSKAVAMGPAKAKTTPAAAVHATKGHRSLQATKHITKVIPRIIIPELKLFIATITASGSARAAILNREESSLIFVPICVIITAISKIRAIFTSSVG